MSEMIGEINILDPETRVFKVEDREYKIKELPLRKVGRLCVRISSIIQKVYAVNPNTKVDVRNIENNLGDIMAVAEDEFFSAIATDILGLVGEDKEWFIDNCPASTAIDMIQAVFDTNERAVGNFLRLSDHVKMIGSKEPKTK